MEPYRTRFGNLGSKTFFADEWFSSSIKATYRYRELYGGEAQTYIVFYKITFDRQIFLIGKKLSLKIRGAICCPSMP